MPGLTLRTQTAQRSFGPKERQEAPDLRASYLVRFRHENSASKSSEKYWCTVTDLKSSKDWNNHPESLLLIAKKICLFEWNQQCEYEGLTGSPLIISIYSCQLISTARTWCVCMLMFEKLLYGYPLVYEKLSPPQAYKYTCNKPSRPIGKH